MMKQQEVLKKIGGIINELNEQYQYLQSDTEHLNSLELELFIANAHFLTDHAEILRKICNAVPPVKELPAATSEPVQPVIIELPEPVTIALPVEESLPVPVAIYDEPELIPEVIILPEPVIAAQEAEPELPLVIEPEFEPAPVIQPEPEVKEVVQPVADVSAPVVSEVREPVQPVVSEEAAPVPSIDLGGQQDTYNYVRQAPEPVESHSFSISSHVAEEPVAPVAGISGLGSPQQAEPAKPVAPSVSPAQAEPAKKEEQPVLTLNQRLSAQAHSGTAASPAAKPVTDLKSAVSLNDKLLFVKDLFNGYNLAYSEALELLNRCKTFDEADHLLKANYVTKNNWQSKQGTANKFYALLQRRFNQ